ncbi:hypothetical protein PHYSODRAFT_263502 [Phytophthora sojae]|uniref:Uncharacterized protein n=1 Tax=Phytophthora sojae (strain P6497) TaxID=1094619 RepID=G4YKN5_PHYSP|nr:hypothetical protein PHYSODRAFT_263502 [Phytophthora sojae]EGZ28867.1 hypothetical protein PHYSODRAFT_263502 [Phytophthora sojae]|eukprot:XP_009516142.1 hypothetical protein PHYSODRAFT_263502 [Phytophthora sojae]
MVIDLTGPDEDSGEQASAARMKEFVADQVRRWERVTLEFVMSPTVEYTWPSPTPDFQAWWTAAMATSRYWFQARAPRVEPIMVRMLMQELQQQLADEHSEWRSVAAGVPNRVIPALDVHALGDAALEAVKEEHPDDDSAVSRRSSGRESSLFGTTAADSEESNPSATSGLRSRSHIRRRDPRCGRLGRASHGDGAPYTTSAGEMGRCRYVGVGSHQHSEWSQVEDVPEAHALPKVKPKQLFQRIQLGGRKAPWPPRIQAPSPFQAVAQSIREVRMDAMVRVDASVQEMKQQLQDKDNASDRKPEAADEGKRTFQTYQATQLLVDREDALENQCALDTQAPVQVIIREATTEKAREVVGANQEDALKRAREAVKAERAQEEHLRSEAEAAKLQVQEARMQKTLEE